MVGEHGGAGEARKYDTTPQCKGWSIDADQNIATCLASANALRIVFTNPIVRLEYVF